MALTDQLTAIGNAIRTKTGGSALIPLNDMPTAILSIGGGQSIPAGALNITGDCKYRFYNGGWDWFIQTCGSNITTSQISNVEGMFSGETLAIPFAINLASSMTDSKCVIFQNYSGTTTTPQVNISASQLDLSNMFDSCRTITQIGTVTYPSGFRPTAVKNMFNNCTFITSLPSWLDGMDYTSLHSNTSSSSMGMFKGCNRLRTISSTLLPKLYTSTTSYMSSIYYHMFYQCSDLDEIDGLGVSPATITSNHFRETFYDCCHLKRIHFAMNNGSVYTANWKNQTIDLSERNAGQYYRGIGYYDVANNSHLPQEKQVTDATSYNALKNDPDWWTVDKAFSRYDHDSAVETINSLPDTSNYGTNIIKFVGAAGSSTDGGAINTLTSAEIAVATAKGWTVTLV